MSEPEPQPEPAAAPSMRERAQQARQKTEFILSRAYGLLKDPKAEWEQIKAEETNAVSLMLGYVAPLAAVPALAGMIGQLVFGLGLYGTPSQIIVGAVVTFLVFTALIYFLGLMTNAIAENFEAEKNELAALKVAAYSPTPAFLLGALSLWPPLWWAPLIGLAIAAFLLYRGLPPLMKCPPERALSYSATIIAAGLIALIVLGLLTSCVTGLGAI
ncbi:MAG: Yip1 family protein [Hyphomonadaceae bacterium]